MTSTLDLDIPTSSSSSSEEDSDEEIVKEVANKPRKKFPCPTCEKCYISPSHLREHIKIHEQDRFVCPDCPSLRFSTHMELRTHQKESHSRSNHKCTECRYTGNKAAVKKHHRLNHIEGVACTIDGCSMKVAKNRLKRHIKEEHEHPEPSTSSGAVRGWLTFEHCPKCDYMPDPMMELTERHEDLMSHIEIIHENNATIMCPSECGKTLKIAELGAHLETCCHSSEAPTTSSEGHTSGYNTNTMTSSRNSEAEFSENELEDTQPPQKMAKNTTGEFECFVCRKMCKNRESLRKHIRLNHSETIKKEIPRSKKFKCDRESCEKSFRTEQALQDHFNVHDGIKPYACGTCSQRFYARDRFAVHLSKYHKMSIKDLNSNERDLGISCSKTLTSS